MKAGIIGFVHRDTLLGSAINEAENIEHPEDGFTPTHVFCTIGEGEYVYVIEALSPTVAKTQWEKSEYPTIPDKVRFIDMHFNQEQLKKYTDFLLAQVGKPYDYLGTGLFQPIHIFLGKIPLLSRFYYRTWWGKYGKDYNRWFCSRLAARTINEAIPGLVPSPDDKTPDELWDYLKEYTSI